MAKILSLSHLTLRFPKPPLEPLLRDISFSMQKGEIICILGANGSGKSTLLKSILGLFDYSGELFLEGKEARGLSVRERARLCSYVPQNYHISFPFSVLEVVLMGRFAHHRFFYTPKDKQEALCALATLGIDNLSQKPYFSLSGGQKQLVLIARALAQKSELILLDEMTSALDISHSFALLEVIKSLKKSVIFTSHHPEQCYIADKILTLKNAQLLHWGSRTEVLNEMCIKELYGIDTQQVLLPNGGVYFCPKT